MNFHWRIFSLIFPATTSKTIHSNKFLLLSWTLNMEYWTQFCFSFFFPVSFVLLLYVTPFSKLRIANSSESWILTMKILFAFCILHCYIFSMEYITLQKCCTICNGFNSTCKISYQRHDLIERMENGHNANGNDSAMQIHFG